MYSLYLKINLKIQTKNMFPTKYVKLCYTNVYCDLPKDLTILTKRFEKHYLTAKTRISEKLQTLRFY